MHCVSISTRGTIRVHVYFTTRRACKEMERESCHYWQRYFKPFSRGNGLLHFKIPFPMPQSTDWVCMWMAMHYTQRKMKALWAWSLEDDASINTLRWPGWVRLEAGLGCLSSVTYIGEGESGQSPDLHYKQWKTEDEFRKWSFLKKQTLNLLDFS